MSVSKIKKNESLEKNIKNPAYFEDIPAFLMNMPLSMVNLQPNNIWMEELGVNKEDMIVDTDIAIRQWQDLYNFLASMGIVYLLPTPSLTGLQDLVYTANSGVLLPHTPNKTFIVSNFKTDIRRNETKIIYDFMKSMNFDVDIAPEYFEGEADFKWIGGNNYIGAHGVRTNMNALKWLKDHYNCNIIPFKQNDPYLYHLDCNVFVLEKDKIILNVEATDKETIKQIEKYCEIIPVTTELAQAGITNSVRVGKLILCASDINELDDTEEGYDIEKKKIDTLNKIAADNGFEVIFFDLSEYFKSGALLSCCVGHLNYCDYDNEYFKR